MSMSNCDSCSQNNQLLNCKSCGPDDPEHQKLVAQKVQDEDERESQATHDIREYTLQLLKGKGYQEDEIEIDPQFTVSIPGRSENVSMDYIIKINGKRFIAVKCSMSMDSRERHVVSFSRVVDSHMIPYAAITDGLRVHLLETATGKTIAETSCIDAFPSRVDAAEEFGKTDFREYPAERMEKEIRVLMAFECAACPKPSGDE